MHGTLIWCTMNGVCPESYPQFSDLISLSRGLRRCPKISLVFASSKKDALQISPRSHANRGAGRDRRWSTKVATARTILQAPKIIENLANLIVWQKGGRYCGAYCVSKRKKLKRESTQFSKTFFSRKADRFVSSTAVGDRYEKVLHPFFIIERNVV